MKTKWIERTLVRTPLYVGLCTSEEMFNREMRRLEVPRSEWPKFIPANAHACVHFLNSKDGDGELALVCIDGSIERDRVAVYALLVHEAMHVWRATLLSLGESRPSSEFEAYGMQSLCQELFEGYDEQTAATPKKK